MRLKVLQLSSAQNFGGGERHLADLSGALAERGHEIHVAHRPDAALSARLPAVTSHTLPLRNALDVVSAWRLARLLRLCRIDLLHAHLARDYPVAALAARWAKRPWVLTRHVVFPLNPLHRLTLRQAAQALAVSSAVAQQLRRVMPAEKVRIIHNGLNLAPFTSAARPAVRPALGLNPGHLLVGMLGDWRPLKGPDDFLRAAAQIAANRSDVSFVLGGSDTSRDGSDRQRLEKLVQELGLTGRVALAGWQDDVAGFYQALDIFVSASRSESFGLTMVEAMAAGVPVVATTTDGAREIITDGVTGKLVSQPAELADAIGTLLNNQGLRARISARARAEVAARFSLTQMAEATESLYQEVILRSLR